MGDMDVRIPTRIIFGVGAFSKLGHVARDIGSRVLVVTGRNSMRRTGVLGRAMDLLRDAGLVVAIWDKVEPNPLSTTVDAGASFAKENQCDTIVGIGGGSAMDAAKGIAIGAYTGGPIWRYMPGRGYDGSEPSGALPVIAVPTTAGTGSEVNRYAVITNPETHEKPGMASPLVYPKVAIVDPELTMSLPPRVTASSGADVLFHAIEAYIHRATNPLSDLFAERAITLVVENLTEAYENPDSIEYRSNMALASTFAGIAIDLAGTVLLHALGHPISGRFKVMHGESLTVLSREFLSESARVVPDRIAAIGRMMKRNVAEDLPVGDAILRAVNEIQALLEKLHLPTSLGQLGIDRAAIPMLVEDVFATMKGCLNGHPGGVTPETVRSCYEKSLARAEGSLDSKSLSARAAANP